jgi:molybdenum cofactor cytidylyltransferase
MEVEGIILAAGLSSRATAFKMTLMLGHKTIIEHSIDNMREVCDRVIVVGGYKIENLEPIIKKYDNAELVFNENFMDGMFSSVKKGFSCIKGERFFFTPGDYPLIDTGVYTELLRHDGDVVIPTFEGKKGHPVLFRNSCKEEILEGNKYSNLREYIKDKKQELVPVSCRGILRDVDTIWDYERILTSKDG